MSEGLNIGRKNLINSIIEKNWKVTPENKQYSYLEVLYIIQEMMTEEGKEYLNPQGHGLRGYAVFREFAQHLVYRNIANYDSMILMLADKGKGKSSAAIMLAREWCKLLGIRFDPKRHIAYSNGDVMRKIDTLNKFEPIICDESVNFATSEGWAKKENKELKKKLAQVRTKHLLYILCFPLKFYKVEKNYLQSFVNYAIFLYDRGKGVIFVKDENPVQDAWRLNDFKSVGAFNEFSSPAIVKKQLSKHPNFWQFIKFPKPPDWLYNKYLVTRETNVYDDRNVLANVSKEDIHRGLLILALRDIMTGGDSSMSINRIILHIKNQYDLVLTKGNVESAIEDAKQLIEKTKEEMLEY